jgi:putative endonuclease
VILPIKTPNDLSSQQIGKIGERIVAYALSQRGYKVLASNVRTKYGEVDLIVRQGKTVLFVEVKTRTSKRYGYPEESVDARKYLHFSRAAVALVSRYARYCDYALVVIAVEFDPQTRVARLLRVDVDN